MIGAGFVQGMCICISESSLFCCVKMDERNVENEDEEIKSISSNDLLTTIYDINRAIFRHLPIHSIDSCALVCRAWAQLAHQTKSHRRTIHTLTYPINPLSATTNCSGLLSDFDTLISSYINNQLWSIPYFAFVVVTSNFEKKGFYSSPSSPPPTKTLKRLRSQTTASRKEHVNISQALTRHLNKSCQILMIASSGVVTTNEENQTNEIESDDAMGILLFPKFPSNILGIYPFEIPRNTEISTDISRADLHRLLGGVPNEIPIRCVIFFIVRHQSHASICMRKLLEYYPIDLVIIGGFIDKIHYDNRHDQLHKSSNICGIILTGDSNHLNIRQVVLPHHIHKREEIKTKFQQLKCNEIKSTFSFAIQVSCVARGSDFYHDEHNVECTEFRNLFPKTPLIGIFGNGEIGHDYLPKDNQTAQEKLETTENLFLTYSSVFSLISINT